jgi:hypothetical protein
MPPADSRGALASPGRPTTAYRMKSWVRPRGNKSGDEPGRDNRGIVPRIGFLGPRTTPAAKSKIGAAGSIAIWRGGIHWCRAAIEPHGKERRIQPTMIGAA